MTRTSFRPHGSYARKPMIHRFRAIAFDVDTVSAASLREGLPGWQFDTVSGATVASLSGNWDPGMADLLVIGARADVTTTLGLCRFLACCTSYSRDFRQEDPDACRNDRQRVSAHLLVLVLPGQETLIGAALEAGARSCLMLPIHPREVGSMLTRARAGNRPGRHTLNLDRVLGEDPWRDAGGEG